MQKILIVEDDSDILFIYTRKLTNAGYEVDQAADGQIGLEKLQTNTYDLVLLDIMLPKLTGIDLLERLKQPGAKAQNTPVYMLTNLAQDSIIEKCLNMGAKGYIIKSQIEPNDIVKEISSFLQS